VAFHRSFTRTVLEFNGTDHRREGVNTPCGRFRLRLREPGASAAEGRALRGDRPSLTPERRPHPPSADEAAAPPFPSPLPFPGGHGAVAARSPFLRRRARRGKQRRGQVPRRASARPSDPHQILRRSSLGE
jgi:hypothetical protein